MTNENKPLLKRLAKLTSDLSIYLVVKIAAHKIKKYGTICRYPFVVKAVAMIKEIPPINPQKIPAEVGFVNKD